MPWRFEISTLNTAWVSLSLLFHALFILILILSKSSITEAEGWAMPTAEKLMRIGIPADYFSDQFVNLKSNKEGAKIVRGFCVDVFEEVVKTLATRSHPIHLYYSFIIYKGSHDTLLHDVADGHLDAAVGDIFILANRWEVVEFTTPYTESGMSLVVPLKPQAPNAWMFLTPFTKELWVTTWAILMYTMFIVWLLEHRSNPEFYGPWKDQLGNVLWFTFSSLFFAHRERIQHNYTRVVVVVWLFVVLIITQSYTANLSSLLTISRLDPNVDSLKKSNAVVGCYGNNAVKEYLENVLQFKKENIRDDIPNQSQYLEALKNGSISAAFLEAPYAKAIVNQYCDQLRITGPTYKFGGFGFVFPKGSPITNNVSQAILRLMEDGTLKTLEDKYFAPSSDCSNFQTAKNNDRLKLRDFWGLYILYVATSTICLLLFLIHSLKNQRRRRRDVPEGNITPTRVSAWKKLLPLTRLLNNAASRDQGRATISSHGPNSIEML